MPASGPSTPGMRDVARLAGVSHQTVSRVINGHPNISPQTRRRVMDAIAALDYRPNAAARALAEGRSRRFGVLLESSSHYGPMSMLRGIEAAARRADYSCTTCTVTSGESFRDGLDFLAAQDVDAVAIIAPRVASWGALRGIGLPSALVMVGAATAASVAASGQGELPRVGVDQEAGSSLAVRHLLELGHRVIVHLAGPMDWMDAELRLARFRAEMAAAGDDSPVVVEGDWTAGSGYEAARRVAAVPGVTAVQAANDQMALGLLHGLADLGLDVPGDISVVGFDDIPESEHFRPPLTTVHQDFRLLGESSVAVMLAELGRADVSAVASIEPVLVERESTRRV